MSFQFGSTSNPFESALVGLSAAAPDFVAVDWDTKEVALLQLPKQTLITANRKVLAYVDTDIEKVESVYLLQELIDRNSATLSKPYLTQLRRLQMKKINDSASHGDLLQMAEYQEEVRKREKERENEINTPPLSPQGEGEGSGYSRYEYRGDYNAYLEKVQLDFESLYLGGKTRVFSKAQFRKMKSIEKSLSGQKRELFIGLVYKTHKDLDDSYDMRERYKSVAQLLNIRLTTEDLPKINSSGK